MLSVKDSLLLKIMKHEKYQICVMGLVTCSHRGINLILFGRSAIQLVCLFNVYLFDCFKSPLLNNTCLRDLNLYEAVKSSGLVVQLKLKCLLMRPTQDDIEAKEVYSQLSFASYKGNFFVAYFKSVSIHY